MEYTTCRLNLVSETVHAVFTDPGGVKVFSTMCGCALTIFSDYTIGEQGPEALTCKRCKQAIAKFVEGGGVEQFAPPGQLYVISGGRWTTSHYYYPQDDVLVKAGDMWVLAPDGDREQTRLQTVCGATLLERATYKYTPHLEEEGQYKSVRIKNLAECLKCCASPRVPATAQTEKALQALKARGRYSRMYVNDFASSD